MAKFTVLAHGIVRNEIASIHKAGCRDIARESREHGSVSRDVEGSLQDAIDYYVDDELLEMGYTVEDVKIHACCKDA